MPVIARCKECGYILHNGGFDGARYLSQVLPRSIISKHDGRCPNCRRELEMPRSKDVTILPNLEYFPRRKGEEVKDDNV